MQHHGRYAEKKEGKNLKIKISESCMSLRVWEKCGEETGFLLLPGVNEKKYLG